MAQPLPALDLDGLPTRSFLSYLAPEAVGRLACTCRRYADEGRKSLAWRHAAWGRYEVFGPRPAEDVDDEVCFVCPPDASEELVLRVLRQMLTRTRFKAIALGPGRGTPIGQGGILKEISATQNLEYLNLDDTPVWPAALEEALRLLPKLRSLVLNDGGGIVEGGIVEGCFFRGAWASSLRSLDRHPGLTYLRLPGDMIVLDDVPHLLRHFPNLHVLDLSRSSVLWDSHAGPRLRDLTALHSRDGHPLRSILLPLNDDSPPGSPVNALR